MPRIELMLDNIVKTMKTKQKVHSRFSTLDLRYPLLQIRLEVETRRQCDFSLMGRNATRT